MLLELIACMSLECTWATEKMKQGRVFMEVGNDGVAIITISNPPVNILAPAIFDGLKVLLSEAMRRPDVRAVVLTGDISIIPDVSINLFVNMIEDAKKPVVAAIEGPVLGVHQTCNIAQACHARIAAKNTQLGLPELNLGVIPASGGTTRLVRLIGLPKALEMLLSSRPITSEEGKTLGLVDAVVPSDELLKVSQQWALDITAKRKNNGKGYYIFEKGSKPKPDPSVLPIIEESRRLTNIMPAGKPVSFTDEEIVEMILFPVVNEACRVLDEGIIIRASDLDVASILGMSFPSYRGGIVFWADTIGADRVHRSLQKWSELYGNFFRPSRFLEERAKRGIQLSAPGSMSWGARPRL
ncbi:Enoyl-CoA isomerase [Handroanthus impetiginosus]|uniref:Enoyl-CoA isomerase n=1 Tax=Handroanthus impetiginosus TaxID=429701 RepID=A0A2G9GSV6_9LAMI|nr:Enoyl-CoA isomerase [Handroanthus impetiginosus]